MLDLAWTAHFKDGTVISQYDEKENETLFKDVLDKQDDLMQFTLLNRHSLQTYIVNLEEGFLSVGRVGELILKPRDDMFSKEQYRYRLIYFREVERTFGSNLKEISAPSYTFFLGYQFKDKDGNNIKKIAKINKHGDMAIV